MDACKNCDFMDEHFACPNFKKGGEASFMVNDLPAGAVHEYIAVTTTVIAYIVEGGIEATYNNNFKKRLSAGELLLFPAGISVSIKVLEDTKSIRCFFDVQPMLCDYFRIDTLEPLARQHGNDAFLLTANNPIRLYFSQVESYIEKGLLCSCLGRYKHQELLHLLRAFYTRKELACFFSPIINKDIFFMDAVRRAYPGCHTVADLARKVNYSVSGFNKRFERCFGMTAHAWMQQQLSEQILTDLRENRISNKEIVYRYDFSSEARFYEFCKRNWGLTPSQIRKGAEIKAERQSA